MVYLISGLVALILLLVALYLENKWLRATDGNDFSCLTPREFVKVKFAKTHKDARTPSYSQPGDNGMDLTAVDHKVVKDENGVEFHEYSTGIALEIPAGYVGIIVARSSVSKKNLVLANGFGTIDSNYRGTISARFKVIDKENKSPSALYTPGERVCQLIILKCPLIKMVGSMESELSETTRGKGGFGSSGA